MWAVHLRFSLIQVSVLGYPGGIHFVSGMWQEKDTLFSGEPHGSSNLIDQVIWGHGE
jgi:hypothetical protein